MQSSSKKSTQQLNRRDFLRDSAAAAAGIAGISSAPQLSFPRDTASSQHAEVPRQPVTSPLSLSRQFAHWVADLHYEDLPPAVVDRVKGLALHAVSSLLIGSQLPGGKQAIQLVKAEESGIRNGATIMVDGGRVTKGGAAFANSEMTLAGGKWDTFRMLTHPGTSIIPCAFAAAEGQNSSGKNFITALAAGYEVMERMASDFIPTVMARGFHASPVFGIFGAALAAAKLMGLSEDLINDTIALCVSLSSGNLESGGIREGIASRNAMFAVSLATLGNSTGESSLEGNAGFYHAYMGNNSGELTYSFVGDLRSDLDKITANLGKDWMLLETLYRIYSTAGYNLAHIDVTAKLCEENNIRYEDVQRVEAVVNWLETQYPSPAFPTRREDATTPAKPGTTRYYTAYGVVKRGFPMLAGTPDPPEVLELMNRVTIIPSHRMPLFGPRITIFTKDGKSYTKQGTGREFIWDFDEEVRRLLGIIPGIPISPSRYDEIVATCRNLDALDHVGSLIQLTIPKN